MSYVIFVTIVVAGVVICKRQRLYSSKVAITLLTGLCCVFIGFCTWAMCSVIQELHSYYPEQYESDMKDIQSYEDEITTYRMEYSPNFSDSVYNSLVLSRNHLQDAINRMETLSKRETTYQVFTLYNLLFER